MYRVVFLVVLVITGFSLASEAKRENEKPNVIIILSDDQGYGDLGCYGAKDIATPNIDNLAESGIRLTDFYSGASVCTPTRASLLTACYPKRLSLHEGVISPYNDYGINSSETLLPEVFGANGYTTALVGKWHLGHKEGMLPNHQGFDLFYGVPYSNDMDGHYYAHNDFQSPPLPIYRNNDVIRRGMNQDSLTYTWTMESKRFIKEQTKSKNPFFLYVAHNMPHWKWAASKEFRGKSNRGLYGDAVEEVDWSVGEIIKTLKECRALDNTIVIFTSDNGGATYFKGGASNGVLRGSKATTWEGGLRVPCIFSWPNGIETSSVSHDLMTTNDIMPTLLTLCDIDHDFENEIDGISMATAIQDDETFQDYPFYFYSRSGDIEAVRKGKWKLHIAKEKGGLPDAIDGVALYDLSKDMGETTNVAGQYSKVVKQLKEGMLQFDKELDREMRPVMH